MGTDDLNLASRKRLNLRTAVLFDGETLFDRLARVVCEAGCLPRKELFEAWEVARRVRRRFRGGRVVDLAAGHGLLAWTMLLLDDRSPEAVCVDPRRPPSAERLRAVIEARWPRLQGRVRFVEEPIAACEVVAGDLVVSAHACGSLTDEVIAKAIAARARVAVLPCCHALDVGDSGGLEGWMDGPLAQDATRAARLRAAGYAVYTQHIPEAITPKNRLLIAEPR